MKRIGLLFLVAVLGGCWNTGTASIKGYIVKMDGEGIIWKTMEAKMMEGSLNSGHMSGEINVPKYLVAAFTEAQDKGLLVKVTYHGEIIIAPWRGSSNKVADKIEVLGPA